METTVAIFRLADRDMAHAEAAASWIGATHPGVTARIRDCSALLEAHGSSEEALRLAWRAALLNERLVDAARTGRASVLADLLG